MIIHRSLENVAKQAVLKMPVLTVTGPRQSGKTTFLKRVFKDYTYVNLEDPEMRLYASTDSKGFLEKFHSKVIFDEVQNAPGLFSYIQVLSYKAKKRNNSSCRARINFY